jgi:4-aminobutyrate aminotransferase-like enzyme
MASLLLRRSAASAAWSSSSPSAAAATSSARPRDGGFVANATAGRRRHESTTIHLGCLDDDDDDDDAARVPPTATTRTVRSAKSHIARGVGRLTDLVFTSGSGSYVRTTCGKLLLDFTSGIGVVNTGHSHPAVISAAKAQLDSIVHSQVNLGHHDRMLELTELLLPNMPRGLDTLYYGTTGAEAVENAVKMARAFTGKHAVVVFRGGYHGRTFGTMAMTVSIVASCNSA